MSAARRGALTAALFTAAGRPAPEGSTGFEAELVALHRQGGERWPGVDVEAAVFARALGRRLGARLQGVASLALVRSDEVFLATACEARSPRAIAHLERAFFAQVRRAVTRQVSGGDGVDDVLQSVRQRLFAQQPPGIASFQGAGPLQSWLCAAAVREALDQLRRSARYVPEDDVERVQAHVEHEVGVDYVRQRYAGDFKQALRVAFEKLDPDERLLLRWSHIDRVSIDGIAALQQSHRATAARRVNRARARLIELTRADLIERLALSEQTLESLIRVVRVDLDITLPSALRTRGR
jgi:RNA polymerase sigma-70 factor